MKKIFIVSIIFIIVSFFIVYFIFGLNFFQYEETSDTILYEPKETKEISEMIEKEEIKKEAWQELLGDDPPLFYGKRYAIFKLPFKETSGEFREEFVGNIIVLPYPLFPSETLTILAFTDISSEKSKIRKIKGSVIQNEIQVAAIDFLPHRVKEKDNKFIVQWIGTKERLDLQIGEYFLQLKGYGENNVLIDEIYSKLIIKAPNEIHDLQ